MSILAIEFARVSHELEQVKEQLLQAQADAAGMRGALNALALEAGGFVGMADPATHGHTNIAVLRHHIATAKTALSSETGKGILAELERFSVALEKVNGIRNSVVGSQTLNWSEHVYPLVSALDGAGFGGLPYPEARENFGTTLERALKSEAEVSSLKAELEQARKERDEARGALLGAVQRERKHCVEIIEDERKTWGYATDATSALGNVITILKCGALLAPTEQAKPSICPKAIGKPLWCKCHGEYIEERRSHQIPLTTDQARAEVSGLREDLEKTRKQRDHCVAEANAAIQQAVADEREAAAKTVLPFAVLELNSWLSGPREVLAAIRARGQEKQAEPVCKDCFGTRHAVVSAPDPLIGSYTVPCPRCAVGGGK